MRKSGRILADTICRVLDAVAPGRTTFDLDRVAEQSIAEQGATPSFKGYRGASWTPFPATICASLNDEIVHGIPSKRRRLEEGDLLSLDFGAIWEGFHSDSAVTVFVGGIAPNNEAELLVKTTETALGAAIEQVNPGGRLSDIGHAIEQTAAPEGFGIVRSNGGHGIGRAMHEEPLHPELGETQPRTRGKAWSSDRHRAHAQPGPLETLTLPAATVRSSKGRMGARPDPRRPGSCRRSPSPGQASAPLHRAT